MSPRKLTRPQARQRILTAAETIRLRSPMAATVKPYTMRRLQQAVCVVRRRQAVNAKVLEAAGFRATERR